MTVRFVLLGIVSFPSLVWSQNAGSDSLAQKSGSRERDGSPPDLGLKLKLTPLNKQRTLWIDANRKVVVAQAVVTLREGLLEMFACPRHTKEHESVVAVDCKAFELHTALLGIGLQPGAPVRFRPEYVPATGPSVAVQVYWREKGSLRHADAKTWVRDVRTRQSLPLDWVFAGSGFMVDPETDEEYYLAESGDLICVSNFPTAMLDLPIVSSQQNAELLFEAFTENIPELGTTVYVLLEDGEDRN